jgi:F-box protein 18 (helicase)
VVTIKPMKPTEEQQAIITSRGRRVRAKARAGSGKTATLVKYAEARPTRKILLIAFNKAIQEEAKVRFGRNVTTRTSHSMAWESVGYIYERKLVFDTKAPQISEALNLAGGRYQLNRQSALLASQQVSETLKRYFASKEAELATCHVNMGANAGAGIAYKASDILEMTHAYWKRMRDPSDHAVGMLPDGYLKLYQLSRPYLPFDDILFDEAQDANPCTLDIVESQDASQVYVGDEYQSIYQFRGAVNAMQMIEPDADFVLTGSFRFGPHVATVANALLHHLRGEKTRIRGLGAPDRLGPVSKAGSHAVICRSNATVFDEAVIALGLGKKVAFIGGTDGNTFEKALDGYRLMQGELDAIVDPYVRSFGSYDRMLEFAEATDDPAIKSIKRMVDKYGNELPGLTKKVIEEAVAPAKADVTLMTAHQSKGLEFDNVRLTDDFISLLTPRGTMPDPSNFRDEDVNVLYVAATRAKLLLEPNGSLASFLKRSSEDAKSPIPAAIRREIEQAGTSPQLLTNSAAVKHLVAGKQASLKQAVFGGRFNPAAL